MVKRFFAIAIVFAACLPAIALAQVESARLEGQHGLAAKTHNWSRRHYCVGSGSIITCDFKGNWVDRLVDRVWFAHWSDLCEYEVTKRERSHQVDVHGGHTTGKAHCRLQYAGGNNYKVYPPGK